MKNLENIPEAIFDLIAHKSYDELSASEKAQVNAIMSELDYRSYQNIVHDFQALDANFSLEKSKPISPKKKESTISRILKYPVPLYQVAAAFLLLSIATFAIPDFKKNKPQPNTVQVEDSKSGVGKSLANDEYPEELVFNF